MGSDDIKYFSSKRVKKKGREDGRDWFYDPCFPFRKPKESDPPLDQEAPALFEENLSSSANTNIAVILTEWSKVDERLSKNCHNAEDRFKQARGTHGQSEKDHDTTIGRYEKAKQDFINYPRPHISQMAYWIFFSMITAAEILFNGFVFSIFGQDEIHTYVMAAGVIIAIPVFSDFIGKKLRMENKSKTTIAMMIGASIIVLALFFIIALLREIFFEAYKMVEKLGVKWDSSNIIISFFVINIGVFSAIVALAREAGHKNPEEFKRIKREFEDAEKEWKEDSGELDEAEDELLQTRIAFNKAHAERIHAFEEKQHYALLEANKWVELIKLYRTENMAARRVKTRPRSFYLGPEKTISIPESLRALDCNGCIFSETRKDKVPQELSPLAS